MTRAIIPVHLYGQPAEIEPILEIANKYSLTVIEDCSQAHISEYKNRKVGNFGSVGTFSFYPGKNLGAYGEGGAVVTNDSELYEKMLRFRQHGSTEKYIHDSEGANYRMEEIQAGVLNVKLKYITGWTEDRGKIASLYSKKLSDTDIIMPFCPPHIKHVYHLYIIRAKKRNQLQKYLSEKGIQTLLHYPMPLHLQKAYDYLKYKNGDFPAAEKCCSEILSLPMFPELTDQQIDYVCDSVRSFYN